MLSKATWSWVSSSNEFGCPSRRSAIVGVKRSSLHRKCTARSRESSLEWGKALIVGSGAFHQRAALPTSGCSLEAAPKTHLEHVKYSTDPEPITILRIAPSNLSCFKNLTDGIPAGAGSLYRMPGSGGRSGWARPALGSSRFGQKRIGRCNSNSGDFAITSQRPGGPAVSPRGSNAGLPGDVPPARPGCAACPPPTARPGVPWPRSIGRHRWTRRDRNNNQLAGDGRGRSRRRRRAFCGVSRLANPGWIQHARALAKVPKVTRPSRSCGGRRRARGGGGR